MNDIHVPVSSNGTSVWSRQENLNSILQTPHSKILIIGGGIHGAAVARLAGLNRVDCLLLERGDYASGTSSRSSKMAHGGLRYLENFDFEQVFEGIKAREEMFLDARHLVKPERFLIPIKANDHWLRLKLGVGLHLYDLLVKSQERKHRWVPRKNLKYQGFSSERDDLLGCYLYSDGLMNDARMVIESIVQARQLGTRCLNYAEVASVTRGSSGVHQVVFKDKLTSTNYEVTADAVVNCAGPWVPFIGNIATQNLSSQLKYSVGTHLLFDIPWNSPSLFLEMAGKSRYYFIWPHPGGTMVGTTEREVTELPEEQMPTASEVDEILERLRGDLPDSGLDRNSLFYAFAGVRTLPTRDGHKGTAQLSRKHLWKENEGILTLLGGKFTTANWTAFEGFKLAMEKTGSSKSWRSLSGIPYPGDGDPDELLKLENDLIQSGLELKLTSRIMRRLGVRAAYLLQGEGRTELITPQLTRGELELAVQFEQAETVEDILRRRTEIEYLPGCGVGEAALVEKFLANSLPDHSVSGQAQAYTERIQRLLAIMGI